MDKITMSRMEFYGYHGVFPEENKLGQRFYVDAELFFSLEKAGTSDHLEETINYADVYGLIREIVEKQTFRLIEALAETIASAALAAYDKIEEITVRVIKPHPPFDIHFAGVTIEIHRIRPAVAYIALGSNIGDRKQYLSEAIRLLTQDRDIRETGRSSIYDTDPVGYANQEAFLNMALRVETRLSPETLLARMLSVERQLGRVRDIRFGPRTIDLDLLTYGSRIIDTPELTLPHPRMAERAFVLIPLLEIAGDLQVPACPSLAERLQTLEGKEGVRLWKRIN